MVSLVLILGMPEDGNGTMLVKQWILILKKERKLKKKKLLMKKLNTIQETRYFHQVFMTIYLMLI